MTRGENKTTQSPTVPVGTLREAFDAVHGRMDYTAEDRATLWEFAKSDNARAYRNYQAIVNSWNN